jgi:Tol biopolymer transport system component
MRTPAAELLALALVVAMPARAGGPRSVNGLGQPMAWGKAVPIVYNLDQGPLGQLSESNARALATAAFAVWGAEGVVSFTPGTPLPSNVDAAGTPATNPNHLEHYWRVDGDGISPVIFDQDGSIIDELFGEGARFDILGASGLDTPIGTNTTITGASIVINGAFYDGIGLPTSPVDLPSQNALEAVIVHEIGHFLNLDHSVVNGELANDGNLANDRFVPTMYPILVDNEVEMLTLNPDDKVALQSLYAAAAPAIGIRGSVTWAGLPFQDAQVVVRDASDPLMKAYSGLSGSLWYPCNPGSICDPCNTTCDPGNPPEKGKYAIDYLPAANYTICVRQIDREFSVANNNFIGPIPTPPVLAGPEECWAAGESGAASDDPDDVTTIVVSSIQNNIDIQLNALPTSDPFEPNDSLAAPSALADLPSGSDTVGAFLAANDRDIYAIPVATGQRVRVDVDAAELGSTLDAVVGLYDTSNVLITSVDDAVDPDTHQYSLDPAFEWTATFTGTAELVVSSYPDLDLDGAGGATTGGYWLRVQVRADSDGDGVTDERDACPNDPADDADGDGRCANVDNCPVTANPGQQDGDGDGVGDACDNCVSTANASQANADGDALGDACDACPNDPANDADGDGKCANVDNCPTKPNPLQGPSIVISGPMIAAGDVNAAIVSSDSGTVVFRADKETDEVFELYATPSLGGSWTKLSGTLVANGDVTTFAISPDNSRVVFLADKDADEVFELYSVPIGGGVPTKLNGSLVTNGDVTSFAIDATSARVVYRADQAVDEQFELYSMAIGGGAATRLNGVLAPTGDVSTFTLTPDGSRVVFLADPTTDEQFNVYGVPIAGGASVQLNGTLIAGGSVSSFAVSPDSSRVVYLADQSVDQRFELYTVASTGGSATKLNGTLLSGSVGVYKIAPGGSFVVYFGAQTGGNLWRVALAGGAQVSLGSPGTVSALDITADSARAVFQDIVGTCVGSGANLFSVPATGGSTVQLTNSATGPGVEQWKLSPDGVWAVLQGRGDCLSGIGLSDVPVAGGTPKGLENGVPPAGGGAGAEAGWLISSDSLRVVYRYPSGPLIGRSENLWSAPLATGVVSRVNSALPNGRAMQPGFVLTPDSSSSVYFGDENTAGFYEMFIARFDSDPDGDGLLTFCDNCPNIANSNQADRDHDGIGDACDTDADGDGVPTPQDCDDFDPATKPGAVEICDGKRNDCSNPAWPAVPANEGDDDGDGTIDCRDNCPTVPNADQKDSDGDGIGDACEADQTGPAVVTSRPADGEIDVAPSSDIVMVMSEPIDPATATPLAIVVARAGIKVSGVVLVSEDHRTVSFDPLSSLTPGAVYSIDVNAALRDPSGNAAIPFHAAFDTIVDASAGTITPDQIGDPGQNDTAGAVLAGSNANDESGFASAVVGDVNADGIADIVIGAPNADVGATVDAGSVRIVFGGVGLQSNSAARVTLTLTGTDPSAFVGKTVARAGDLNGDGIADIAIGAPDEDVNGADSGAAYIVFGSALLDEAAPGPLSLGNLASCSTPPLCGIVLRGAAPGDRAGTSVSYAGDLNGDGKNDLIVGAPGASPLGRAQAGIVYLIYGPLSAGTYDLSAVGTTALPGVVFHGEASGDRAGEALSWWEDDFGIDDLLIGAPGATPNDEFGLPLQHAGYVYAIHGGTANLVPGPTAGVIDLSRAANNQINQLNGVVFVGSRVEQNIGRSVTGAADINGDGIPDIAFGARHEAWVVPGDGPKTVSGTSQPKRPQVLSPTALGRAPGSNDAVLQFGAFVYTEGSEGDLGGLNVGGAGDVNHDGYDDLVIGAPEADVSGKIDAGKAYIVFGSPSPAASEIHLSDVGHTTPGITLSGLEAGDALGTSVGGGGGDVNGDFISDAIVGAPYADSRPATPQNAGETYVISPLAPAEVTLLGLRKVAGTTELDWARAARALAYDVYRGVMSSTLIGSALHTSTMVPLACRIAGDADADGRPDTTDPDVPPPGEGYVYLVTGTNENGEGIVGPLGDVPRRVHDGHCP